MIEPGMMTKLIGVEIPGAQSSDQRPRAALPVFGNPLADRAPQRCWSPFSARAPERSTPAWPAAGREGAWRVGSLAPVKAAGGLERRSRVRQA